MDQQVSVLLVVDRPDLINVHIYLYMEKHS